MKRAPASFSPRAPRLALAVALVVIPPLLAGALTRQGSSAFALLCGRFSRPCDAGYGDPGVPLASVLPHVWVGDEHEFESDAGSGSALTTEASPAEWVFYSMGCVDPGHRSMSSEYVFKGPPEDEEGVFAVRHGWILESAGREPSLVALDLEGSTGRSPHGPAEEYRSATETWHSDESARDSKGEGKP